MTLTLGPGPTMEEALSEILRVGGMIGGLRAAEWALELREIVARADEGSRWGPRGVTWNCEAARLMLAADVAEYGYRRRTAMDGAKALTAALPKLAAKATDGAEELEVAALRLDLEVAVRGELEQVRLAPKGRRHGGKAMHSDGELWSRDKSADFERFIRRIGGYTVDGLPADGPLDYDDAHFERATALVRNETEPASAAEVRALATWRARYPA